MERLKSKIRFIKGLINVYDYMNFITKSNNYNKMIEQYQNDLSSEDFVILIQIIQDYIDDLN